MGKLLKLDVSNHTLFSLFYFPGLMEIRSVSVGVVAIKSVSTGLYLAMSKKGTLFGSVRIQPGDFCFYRSRREGWGGLEGIEVTYRESKITCLILLKWRNNLRKVQIKVRVLQSIMAVHLGRGWWYLQLQMACFIVKIGTGGKGNQTSTDKEPAGIL